MEKEIFFILLFALCILSALPADSGEKISGVAKASYNDENMISAYVSVENNNFRAVAMEFLTLPNAKNENIESKTVFSLYTPYVTIGRIKAKGLLKEIKNPAAHSTGSQTFMEESSYAPEYGFSETGSTGIIITPIPFFSVFMEVEGDGIFTIIKDENQTFGQGFSSAVNPVPLLYGIYSSSSFLLPSSDSENYLISKPKIDINLAFSVYKEKKEETDDSNQWYSDGRTQYGRTAKNSTLSFLFQFPFAEGEAEVGTGGTASVVTCTGTETGYYYRLSPYFEASFIRLDLLLAGTTENYLRPNGTFPSVFLKKGLSLYIYPSFLPSLTLRFKYTGILYHPTPENENYGNSTDEYYGSLLFNSKYFSATVFGNFKKSYTEEEINESLDIGFSAGIKWKNCKIVFEKTITIHDKSIVSDTMKLEGGFRFGIVTFYITGKIKIAAPETKEEATNSFIIDEKTIGGKISVKIKLFTISANVKGGVAENIAGTKKQILEYKVSAEMRF